MIDREAIKMLAVKSQTSEINVAREYCQDVLVEEKIAACVDRGKPRDFYDIYFLLRAGLVPVEQRRFLSKVLEKLGSTKINFSSELKIFLPVSLHGVIKNFKQTLVQEINRFASTTT